MANVRKTMAALEKAATCNIFDFEGIRLLGGGVYGEVVLARFKKTENAPLVAIKVVRKDNLIQDGGKELIQSAFTEKDIQKNV